MVRADGSLFWASGIAERVLDQDGKEMLIATFHDITAVSYTHLLLGKIHKYEKQIECLDYLVFQMKRAADGTRTRGE